MRLFSILGVWITGIVGTAAIGAFTNAINGRVSELYFRTIMRWESVIDIQRAIIAQGVFEGLVCGLILSTLFTAVVAIVSGARCSYVLGARFFAGLFATALACWALGGALAMGLVWLSPEFYRSHFIGVPEGVAEQLHYAWVGGSIWGIQFGGAAATFLFMALFRAKWRALNQ